MSITTLNTTPIFTGTPDIQWSNIYATASNATTDLTSGVAYLIYTSDSSSGGYVQKMRFKSSPGSNNAQTVARIWLNNGLTTGSAANNVLIDEITLAAVTGVSNVGTIPSEVPLNFALPAGYRIYVTLGTAVASGYAISVIGGKY